MSRDNIILGPWAKSAPGPGTAAPTDAPASKLPEGGETRAPQVAVVGAPDTKPEIPPLLMAEIASKMPGLTVDQVKAISLVLSGSTFVFVAIRPTEGGADFLTALHGDHTDLRNALPELPGVIERLYGRKGI